MDITHELTYEEFISKWYELNDILVYLRPYPPKICYLFLGYQMGVIIKGVSYKNGRFTVKFIKRNSEDILHIFINHGKAREVYEELIAYHAIIQEIIRVYEIEKVKKEGL